MKKKNNEVVTKKDRREDCDKECIEIRAVKERRRGAGRWVGNLQHLVTHRL